MVPLPGLWRGRVEERGNHRDELIDALDERDVGRPGQHRELRDWKAGQVAGHAPAEQAKHLHGTHEHHMLLARQELQGEDLLQLATVELDRRGPVESIQRDAVLKASLHQVAFEGLLVAALDLVGQQQRQKRHIIELLGTRQRQPLGQGRHQLTQLEPFKQTHEIWIGGHG